MRQVEKHEANVMIEVYKIADIIKNVHISQNRISGDENGKLLSKNWILYSEFLSNIKCYR